MDAVAILHWAEPHLDAVGTAAVRRFLTGQRTDWLIQSLPDSLEPAVVGERCASRGQPWHAVDLALVALRVTAGCGWRWLGAHYLLTDSEWEPTIIGQTRPSGSDYSGDDYAKIVRRLVADLAGVDEKAVNSLLDDRRRGLTVPAAAEELFRVDPSRAGATLGPGAVRWASDLAPTPVGVRSIGRRRLEYYATVVPTDASGAVAPRQPQDEDVVDPGVVDLSSITREAVLAALDELDQRGRDDFLLRYGYGPSRQYFLVHEGRNFDSKAIVGVAHGHVAGQRPLHPRDFSGGRAVVVPLLERLGFTILVENEPARPPRPESAFSHGALYDVSFKVFRGDPDRYDLEAAIATMPVDTWNVGDRHVQAGDHVAFYRLAGTRGAARGIIGFGVVLSDPEPMADVNNDLWADPRDGLQIVDRVRVRYVASPNGELLESDHDVVAGLSASRARGGTVFNVDPGQWEQLIQLAGLPAADLRGMRDPTEEPSLPIRDTSAGTGRRERRGRAGPLADVAALSKQNAATGLIGEEWVVEHEQKRLTALGRDDLAARVEHVAVTQGDGLGYDVASFEPDGSARLIEVKTTRGDWDTAFYATDNEISKSRELAPAWILYRVFNVNGVPDVKMTRTPLDEFDRTPITYRVHL